MQALFLLYFLPWDIFAIVPWEFFCELLASTYSRFICFLQVIFDEREALFLAGNADKIKYNEALNDYVNFDIHHKFYHERPVEWESLKVRMDMSHIKIKFLEGTKTVLYVGSKPFMIRGKELKAIITAGVEGAKPIEEVNAYILVRMDLLGEDSTVNYYDGSLDVALV